MGLFITTRKDKFSILQNAALKLLDSHKKHNLPLLMFVGHWLFTG